jgi:hypothetical protein
VKRVLAVVAAVLMITGAVLIRSRLDADESAAELEASKATVVCASELAAVCDQVRREHPELTITVEEASATADRLSQASFSRDATPIDAWLVPEPFPAMVDENRSFAGLDPLFDEASPVLARSPLTLTVWNDRLEKLRSACGGDPTWACIGDEAGQPWADLGGQQGWGNVKPGLPDPTTSAFGLLVLSQASAQELGRTDFASNDLQDPGYQTWLSQLKDSIRPAPPTTSGAALGQMLSQGKGTYDLAGSAESESRDVPGSRYNTELTVLYPSPMITADVVLVPLRGAASGGHAREVFESDTTAAALATDGWRVPGQPPAPGVRSDPLPDTDGLPKPGAVQALHDVWTAT